MNSHVTMFKYCAKNEYIKCVISGNQKSEFEKIGFVDHIDKVKAPAKRKTKVKKDAE